MRRAPGTTAEDFLGEPPTGCPTPQKHRHASLKAAQQHVKRLRRSNERAARGQKPYHCRCGFWHIGSSVANLRRR